MRRYRLAIAGFVLLTSLPAMAQKSRAVVARAAAGDQQAELAVGFAADGTLRAQVCPKSGCDIADGTDLRIPTDARALRASAKLLVGRIARARRVILVEINDDKHRRKWSSIVAAPIGGGSDPKVLFNGWTGLVEGELGLRHGPMLERASNGDGTWNIVLGEQREDLSLCGRPAIVSPKLISPNLTLQSAKVQRLGAVERQNARHISATRMPDDAPSKGFRLLRAFAASSAIGDPAALTDGDPKTTWAEDRGADGRGEFVVMNAPSELPLTGLEVVIRPPEGDPERGVAPRDFWIATPGELLYVEMPEDAWKHPGARYEIPLDPPLKVDCMALVTESGYQTAKDVHVTFAELGARTEFDATTVDGLVGALAGGGTRAEAAGEALRALGDVAYLALTKAFPRLDEGGRRVALSVIDGAPCATSVEVYVKALSSTFRAHRIHARERLRHCGTDAGKALATALPQAAPRLRPLLASELALIDPPRAISAVVPLVAQADDKGRALLRKALGFATRDPKTQPVVNQVLSKPLPDKTAIDLLRALGDRIGAFQPAASQTLARLLAPGANFRTRYLLIGPLSHLAKSDPNAKSLLARAITQDESQYVRTEAAGSVRDPSAFQSELVRALADPEVRVREAALETLATKGGSFASDRIVDRLHDDHWPLVRAAAAAALSRHGASAKVDDALGEATADDSAQVRATVVVALGERGAVQHADKVRELLDSEKETIEVRVSSALALGLMCDVEAASLLTKYARRLGDPMASPDSRALGPVALGALGRIQPPDLRDRLAPLLDKKTALLARRAAEAALSTRSSCGRRASRPKR